MPPFGFFVYRGVGEGAEGADGAAVDFDGGGGRLRAGGSFMKGMNLSGKPGMVQPMQMPPTLGQPPMPFIQPRLGTLQFTTGPQHPILTRHLGEPYSRGEIALFIEPGAIAAFVDGQGEQPGWAEVFIEGDHRASPAT